MRSDRFDELTRLIARGKHGKQSRRGLLRAVGAGGTLAALGASAATAAPDRMVAIRARNQDAAIDPLIDETAFNLEYDVERIFGFVRDEVRYDPYAGVLRGAKGTLWGLAGNAADQAVLLAALLNASLVTTRFVIGELTEDVAGRLLDATIQDEGASLRHAAKVLIPSTPAEAPAPLTAEEEAFARDLPGFAERYRAAVDSHLAQGIRIVTDALTGAGIDLPDPSIALPELERNQHVWLQYSEGTQWIDLDPSLPESEPGDAYAENPGVHNELPAELVHRVTLRLVAEQITGGAATRQELVSHTAASAELVGVPMTIFHPQAEAMRAAGQAITGEIGGYRNFMTTLIVGEEVIAGKPVTFSTGGGALDVFGDSAAVEGDTIAEWLEVDIQTPAGSRQVTRELFDRVGFAERQQGPVNPATIRPLELVDAGDPELSYLPLAGMWSISVVSGAVPADYFGRSSPEAPQVADLAEIALAYHYSRDVFSLRSRFGADDRIFFNEPNVTGYVLRPTAVAEDRQSAETGIDLLYRSLAIVGANDDPAASHPLIAAGVLSYAVERAMVESGGDPLFDFPVLATSGVGNVFDAAKSANLSTLVLLPDDQGVDMQGFSGEARLRIQAALAAGFVVILPRLPVSLAGAERSGWWLVDPATGATFDQMDGGGGVELSTYAVHLKLLSCMTVFLALGAGIYYAAQGTSILLAGDQAEGSSDPDTAAAAAAARSAAAYGAGRRAFGGGAAGGAATAICAA